jgi:hypothetical protein
LVQPAGFVEVVQNRPRIEGNEMPAAWHDDQPLHSESRTMAADSGLEPAEIVTVRASGWLVPVLSLHNRLPQFALTDYEGSILYFVVSTMELDLRRFARRRVTIVGRPKHTPHAQKPHLILRQIMLR